MKDYEIDDRVVLKGHSDFADGITGTVAKVNEAILELCPSGEWVGSKRTRLVDVGVRVSYYIEFDESHDDGSGDGPYRSAEIGEECLYPIATIT